MTAMLVGKRILITGSSGFVGRHLVKHLSEGNEVFGADVAEGHDLEDAAVIDNLPSCEIVFHLAALAGVPRSFEEPHLYLKRNLGVTVNMLEYARRRNAVFIFASSYLYGRPRTLPTDETHPVQVTNPYMASKHLSEETCRLYHELYGMKGAALRFFNIYGPGQRAEFIIPEIVAKAGTGGTFSLRDPNPKRDFVFIADVIRAYEAAAIFAAGASSFEAFNIGSGEAVSVREIVEDTSRILGRDLKVEWGGATRQNEIAETRADIGKAKRLLGWAPGISFLEGMKLILKDEGMLKE